MGSTTLERFIRTLMTILQSQNGGPGLDYTVRMERWLNESDLWKVTGSLPLWVKGQLSAERLGQIRTAIFGAINAFYAKWEH